MFFFRLVPVRISITRSATRAHCRRRRGRAGIKKDESFLLFFDEGRKKGWKLSDMQEQCLVPTGC
jgi:hypothetical protein